MSDLLTPRRKDGSFPFDYKNSASTDVTVTWERARQRLKEEYEERERIRRELQSKLTTLRRV